MDDIRNTLSECLEIAGKIQSKHFNEIREEEIEFKKDEFDLLTVADEEVEQAVIGTIQRRFPDHAILAEESGAMNRPGASVRWIIDPIDGTTNYSHGFPIFCISIGVEIDGEVRMGAVYNPIQDECFRAEKGKGATLNGRPIGVSRKNDLSKSLLVTGFPYDRRERADHYMELYKTFMLKCHGILRLGAAALDLCYVAAGRVDGYYEESLNQWDWAAGMLIVQEAGGMFSDYHNENRYHERRQLCASNGKIHRQLIEILQPSVPGT